MQNLSETRVLMGKQFEHLRQKRRQNSRPFQNIRGNTKTQSYHLDNALVNSKK